MLASGLIGREKKRYSLAYDSKSFPATPPTIAVGNPPTSAFSFPQRLFLLRSPLADSVIFGGEEGVEDGGKDR